MKAKELITKCVSQFCRQKKLICYQITLFEVIQLNYIYEISSSVMNKHYHYSKLNKKTIEQETMDKDSMSNEPNLFSCLPGMPDMRTGVINKV